MKKTIKFLNFLALFTVIAVLSVYVSGCKDDDDPEPAGDKTALNALVTECETLHDAAIEGTSVGFYEVGSKAVFQTAIEAAKSVANTEGAIQSVIDGANANLTAAKTVFEGKYIQNVSTEGLVAQWLFSGDATDYTGNGFDGTLTNGPAVWGGGIPVLTSDRFGNADKAYYFNDGGNIEVTYATALNPPEISLSWWIYMEERDNNDYMISMNHWEGYKVNLQTENKVFATVKVEDGAIYDKDHNGEGLVENTWYHLVVSFGAEHMKFYIDGALVQDWPDLTGGGIINLSSTPVNLVFGLEMPLSTYDPPPTWDGAYFKGKMDDIRLYNRVLSDNEVSSIYNLEKPQ
nr:LamG domain-containing protein [Bacteroidota bacterium]